MIGGYAGATNGAFPGLLVDAHDEAGQLIYVGRAVLGSGREATIIRDRLDKLLRPTSPFVNLASMKAAVWFEPKIAAEIQYQCWSRGYLRHGSFKGPRDDRDAAEIRLP